MGVTSASRISGASFFDTVWTVISDAGRSIKNVLAVRWCDRTPFLVRLRDFSDGQLPKPEALPRLIAAEAPGTAEAWVWKTSQGRESTHSPGRDRRGAG